MIIPPAAITIGALLVVTNLLFSGLFNRSDDSGSTTDSEGAQSRNTILITSCRFESKTVPFRDLAPTSKLSSDTDSSKVELNEISSSGAEEPNEQALIEERLLDRSHSEEETPRDTAE